MIKLKLNGVYKTKDGTTVTIRKSYFEEEVQEYTYVGSNSMYYRENGYLFGYPFEDDQDRIISEVDDATENGLALKATVESFGYSLNHSDIQLLRKNLINRLKDIKYPISASEARCEYYHNYANPDTPEGIRAFHELNSAKDSLRKYKKERKHVAELLRKLKKQQAEILRNNAKV